MLKIGNTIYVIDISKLMLIVSKTPQNEKNIVTSLTQVYPLQTDDNDEDINITDIASKEIVETKSILNDTMNNIRYDFLKMLLTIALSIDSNINSLDDLSFSQKLTLNTLLNEGIIIEK